MELILMVVNVRGPVLCLTGVVNDLVYIELHVLQFFNNLSVELLLFCVRDVSAHTFQSTSYQELTAIVKAV
jgi:hypothetical protein